MRRIVSVWLIDWPVTVWANGAGRVSPPEAAIGTHQGPPFALIVRTNRGAILHALNAAARAEGLSRGQTQADARAILPNLESRPADLAADLRALEALAVWTERWSPSVTPDPSPDGLEGLFMDVTGAAHLFGGEFGLLEQIERRMASAGIRARAAIAPTPGAAWALSRHGPASRYGRIVVENGLRDALADVSIEALRIDAATLKQARRFGFKTIGDLYPMPRAGLARRFRDVDGAGLVRRLDQALGLAAEALAPTRPPPRYRAWEAYAEPLGDTAAIESRAPGLMADLATALEQDGQGARTLTLTGFRTDGQTRSLSIRLGQPGRDAPIWMRLFRERGFERIDLGFGVDALMLSADIAEPMIARQISTEDEAAARHAESLTALIDRLSARLGEQAICVAEPQGSWIPERAERWRPALAARHGSRRPDPAIAAGDDRPRPILMLDPPEPVEAIAELPDGAPAQFTWRRLSRRVTRAEGPERLSPEWWRPPSEGRGPLGRQPRTRDYYRVEDDQGLRYWLFREGLYGREYAGTLQERTPSWWMHGMFP
ncbi:DNA polymerase Y family protein [soil metagenome]